MGPVTDMSGNLVSIFATDLDIFEDFKTIKYELVESENTQVDSVI